MIWRKTSYYPRLRELLSSRGFTLSEDKFADLRRVLKSDQPEKLHEVLVRSFRRDGPRPHSIPLGLLFVKLSDAGIEVDTATVLDIQQLLATPSLLPKRIEDLGSVLKPLICKSVSQLGVFDRVFGDFIAEIKGVFQEEEPSDGLKEEIITAFLADERQRRREKVIVIGLALLFAIAGIWYWLWREPKQIEVIATAKVVYPKEDSSRTYFIEGDSVLLEATLSPAGNSPVLEEKIQWITTDTVSARSMKIKVGRDSFTATLLYYTNETIVTDTITINPACEKTPALTIDRPVDTRLGERIEYRARIINPSPESTLYNFLWAIDGKTVSTRPFFDTIFYQTARLRIDLLVTYPKGVHCSADSLSTTIEDRVGDVPITVSGEGDIHYSLRAQTALASVFIGGLSLISFGAYYLFARRFKSRRPLDTTEDPTGEPYSIKFKKHSVAIPVEKAIVERTVNYNKRQASEEQRVDVHKTILATAEAGGFPVLAYRLVQKKQSFIFLIDSSIAGGHRRRVFEFLVDFLQRNQVEVLSFSYYRSPEELRMLSSHNSFTLKGIERHHRETNLVIFSTADNFYTFDDENFYDWVRFVQLHWNNKTLVTFDYAGDLGLKITKLEVAGFRVVPFNLDAITASLFNEAEYLPENGYVLQSLRNDLNDIQNLTAFLGNDQIQQWVFSLAIYPKPDWEMTLTVGKALEKHFAVRPGALVNYSNLEILSQVEWLNDGLVSDDLRSEMLLRLREEVHQVARATLQQLLEEVSPLITPNSAVWDEFTILKTVNQFMLKGLYNDKGYVQANYQKIELLKNTGNLDTATEKTIFEQLPLVNTIANSIRWTAFPAGYIYRLLVPLVLVALLTLAAFNLPATRDIFSQEVSQPIKFIIRNNIDDSLFIRPTMKLHTVSRKVDVARLNDTTFHVTGLSPEEVNGLATLEVATEAGASVDLSFDTLHTINYINRRYTDDRIEVNLYFNDEKFRPYAQLLHDVLSASNVFRPAMAPQVDESIRATEIVSSDRAFKELYGMVKSFSKAAPPGPYNGMDTSATQPRDARISLFYKDVGEPDTTVFIPRIIHSQEDFQLKDYKLLGLVNTTIHLAILDPSSYRAEVLGMNDDQPKGIVPEEVAGEDRSVTVLLGSGFVESFSPLTPNGFLKVKGQVINELKRQGYNGVVGVRKDNLELLSSTSQLYALDGGFQTGPFLVRDRRMVYNTELSSANIKDNRAFIGTNVSGKIVAAVTEGPISLTELSQVLSSASTPSDLRCVTALNLSGGGSEALVVRGDNGTYHNYGSTSDHQSALIGFFRKVVVNRPSPVDTTQQRSQQGDAISDPRSDLPSDFSLVYESSWLTGAGYKSAIAEGVTVYVDSYLSDNRGAVVRVRQNGEVIGPKDLYVKNKETFSFGDYRVSIELIRIKNVVGNPFTREAQYFIKIERSNQVISTTVRPGDPLERNTVTCFVQDPSDQLYIVTSSNGLTVGSSVTSRSSLVIGTVTSITDGIALIKVNNSVELPDGLLYDKKTIIRSLTGSVKAGQDVTIYDHGMSPIRTVVDAVNVTATIRTEFGNATMSRVAQIRQNISASMGAPVLTNEGRLFGFVGASDGKTVTYIIPLESILKKLNLRLMDRAATFE